MRSASLIAVLTLFALVGGAFGVGLVITRSQAPPSAPPWTDVPEPRATPSAARAKASRPSTARQVFGHTCGTCHTLGAAGSTGLFGPNLDEVSPSAAAVRRMIRAGSIDGVMQRDLLTGRDARRVAAYVSRVAGAER